MQSLNESSISAIFAGLIYRYAARDRGGSFIRSIIDSVITVTGTLTITRFIDKNYKPCYSFNSGLIMLITSLGYAAYRAHIVDELEDEFEMFYTNIEIINDDKSDEYSDTSDDKCDTDHP
jgi:hypothetical protein